MFALSSSFIMKNHLSKSPPLNDLDFATSASMRAASATSAAGAVQSKRRLRNRSVSDGMQKKSQSPVDPSILSVLDEDEITSSFSSVDQFGRISPGTPPKKLWERQYNSFLRNRNNNRSTESVASSQHQSSSGLSSSPNSQDSAVRGGKFFSSVFRAGTADASVAGKTRKNASTDELDGTMRRGADKAYYSPRNTQQRIDADSEANLNSMSSGNIPHLPSSSSIGQTSRDRNMKEIIPKILSTEDQAVLLNGRHDDIPPFPPLLIPPKNKQTASKLDQETLSLEKLLQTKCSTGSSIIGALKSPNPSKSTVSSIVTTKNSSSINNELLQPSSSATESAMKKAFTKIRNSTDADTDSAYLGDDPSVSSRQILFTQKNEQLIQHSERISHGQNLLDQQQHRRSQTNISGINFASLEPVHEDVVSIKSTRILRAFSGVETWETGRRYLIGPAALAACPTASLNSLLNNSFTSTINLAGVDNVAADVPSTVFDIIVLGECLLSYITDTPTKQWTSAKLVLRQNYLLEYDSGADIQVGIPRGFAHLEGATTVLHEHFRDALVLHFFGSPCAKTDARSLMIRIRHSIESTSVDGSVHLRPEIRKSWQQYLNRAASLDKISKMYEYDETNVLGMGQYAEVRAARRLYEKQSGNNIIRTSNRAKANYDCAIKIFNKDKFWRMVVKGRERADTIVRETSVQATLLSRCPNNDAFLRIRGFFETSKHVVLELELLESTDLFKYVTSKVVLKESEAAVILRDILRCLIDMSKSGMAHRDIKPANILICEGKQQLSKGNDMAPRMSTASAHIKVCDFGMATFVGVDGQVRGRCGTPGYVAPEIFTAGTYGGYGNKVDVFSAGVTLYVMLSGYEPFYGETDDQLKEANRLAVVEFPSEDWSNVSKEAVDLVKKMMRPDPAMRLDARQALNHPWILKNIPQSILNDAVQDSIESYDQESSCNVS